MDSSSTDTVLVNYAAEIKLLNDIHIDTKCTTIQYIDNTFYDVSSDELERLSIDTLNINMLEIDNLKSIYSYKVSHYTIKEGDIKYYNNTLKEVRNSVVIKSEEERYNKYVISISRPLKINENKVIVYYYGIMLESNDIDGEIIYLPLGGIDAYLYLKTSSGWIIQKHIPIADIS